MRKRATRWNPVRFCMQFSWVSETDAHTFPNPWLSRRSVRWCDGCVWWVALWTPFAVVVGMDVVCEYVRESFHYLDCTNGEMDGNKSIFHAVKLLSLLEWIRLLTPIRKDGKKARNHSSQFIGKFETPVKVPTMFLFVQTFLGENGGRGQSICFHKYFHWGRISYFRRRCRCDVKTWWIFA